jgi:hypothetical protein
VVWSPLVEAQGGRAGSRPGGRVRARLEDRLRDGVMTAG